MSGVIPLQQMSGTLLDLILYLALVALGAFLGSRPQIQSLPMPWLGRFQTAALLLLIVTLGAELGANEEIISSLGTIGLNALAVTLTSMVGSMLAVDALRKYLLKLNAQGRSCQEAPEDSDPGSGEAVHVDHSLTSVSYTHLGQRRPSLQRGGLHHHPHPQWGERRAGLGRRRACLCLSL